MPVVIRVPDVLQPLTGGECEVSVEGETLGELFESFDERFPGVRQWAFDGEGALRPYVSVFVNHRRVDLPDDAAIPVLTGDYVSLVPAIAGASKVTRKLYLTFPQELIREPIIFRIGHEFNVVTNIRGASVSDNVGLVAIEIEGAAAELDRAIEWLKSKGVKVEPLEDEA